MAPTTDDRVCGKAQATVLPGAATGGPSLFTSHCQGLGQQYFHTGPHRSTRHLPAPGRGSSLAEVCREAEEEGDRIVGRSQKRPVREGVPRGGHTCLSCGRGQPRRKAVWSLKGLVDFTTWQTFSSRQDFMRRDYCSVSKRSGLPKRLSSYFQ